MVRNPSFMMFHVDVPLYPMDPWPLSEKVQKSLQIIVNPKNYIPYGSKIIVSYTRVPLPFRRYDWIHIGIFNAVDIANHGRFLGDFLWAKWPGATPMLG